MTGFEPLGRLLMIIGLVLMASGGLLWLITRAGFMGSLPGDIVIRRSNFTLHFPLMTCLILSLLLTLVLNIVWRR